jgi:hypothetical protein
MYEAPRIDAVGTVRGMTLTGGGDHCYDKTWTRDKDWAGYFTHLPIGDDCSPVS